MAKKKKSSTSIPRVHIEYEVEGQGKSSQLPNYSSTGVPSSGSEPEVARDPDSWEGLAKELFGIDIPTDDSQAFEVREDVSDGAGTSGSVSEFEGNNESHEAVEMEADSDESSATDPVAVKDAEQAIRNQSDPKPVTRSLSPAFSTEFRREVNPDELRLDVHQHASALSHVFQTATGEFCFALFGCWGRGKSTLLKCLKGKLEQPDTETFKDHKRYSTVDFSAWKYRTVPEVWIHLYESVAAKATTGGLLASAPISLRANVYKYGIWPLIWGFCLLGIALVPLGQKINFVTNAVQLVSFGGACYLLSLFAGTRNSGLVGSVRKYLTLNRHNEKLGLQAAIGDDLKALVVGWIPSSHRSDIRLRKFDIASYVVAGIFVMSVIYSRLPEFGTSGSLLSVAIGVGVACSLTLAWLSCSAWAYSCVRGPVDAVPIEASKNATDTVPEADVPWHSQPWFWINKRWLHFTTKVWAGQRLPDRVLLCVDDLDRCEPDTMLEIIESLKLLLDETEFNQRLQVVFLIDRQILDLAILERFKKLTDPSTSTAPRMPASRVIHENHEKCFSASFELLSLQTSDVISLVKAYTDDIAPSTPGQGDHSQIEAGDVTYSDDDRKALKQAFGQTVDKAIGESGPRRIRYVLFQYQLAKLLLREQRVELTDERLENLATSLVNSIVENERTEESTPADFDAAVLQGVLRQVVGTRYATEAAQ